jgi:hypothetical protein
MRLVERVDLDGAVEVGELIARAARENELAVLLDVVLLEAVGDIRVRRRRDREADVFARAYDRQRVERRSGAFVFRLPVLGGG